MVTRSGAGVRARGPATTTGHVTNVMTTSAVDPTKRLFR